MMPAGYRGELCSTGFDVRTTLLEPLCLLFLQVLIETVLQHVGVEEPFLPVEVEPFGSRLPAKMTN